MKKYILFDLDGTLTDPMEGICKSAARGLAHFGINADIHDLTFFIGPPLLDTYREQVWYEMSRQGKLLLLFVSIFSRLGFTKMKFIRALKKC